MKVSILCIPVFILFFSSFVSAQLPIKKNASLKSITLNLWPEGKVPGKNTAEPESATHDGTLRITNVSIPDIAIFKASGSKKATPAVIICPGGGYHHLAYDKEGTEIASWLNSMGITGIVLKYRVPGNREGAFQDLQRAMRLVRRHKSEWNIDDKHIGLIGFSAGGHLVTRLSNNFEKATYSPVDKADSMRMNPNFVMLVYPAYLKNGETLDPQLSVKANTPPTFIAHTEDDPSFVVGSKMYHQALLDSHISTEFLLLPDGGHGYGLQSTKGIKVWPLRAQAWLKKIM